MNSRRYKYTDQVTNNMLTVVSTTNKMLTVVSLGLISLPHQLFGGNMDLLSLRLDSLIHLICENRKNPFEAIEAEIFVKQK